jgi:DNA-binding MarR family transcriptional regulator
LLRVDRPGDLADTSDDQLAVADGVGRLLLWARRAAPTHMSSTSITTLDRLCYAGPLRVTDLADLEGVSQPGMTTLVNRLCLEGHARRFPDPSDGRASLVDITTAGRDVLVERHAERSHALKAAIGRLPPKHQAALSGALEALQALTQTIMTNEDRNP